MAALLPFYIGLTSGDGVQINITSPMVGFYQHFDFIMIVLLYFLKEKQVNKLSPQPSSLVLAEGQPIITGSYQAPTIDVYNPNQLTQSAEQIMSETNGGYYS